MKFHGLFTSLLAVLAFQSCAKLNEKFGRTDSGLTKVIFSRENEGEFGSMAILNGGVMIYVIGSSAQTKKTFLFSSEDLANGAASVSLPNGLYKFYMIGFTAADMGGNVKCAAANDNNDVSLTGAPKVISFVANAASCALSAFSPGSSANDSTSGFKALQIVSCQSGTNLNPFTDSSTCVGSKGGINHTRSVQIELVGYDLAGESVTASNSTSGIKSACMRGVGLPLSNSVYTTSDTQANAVFTSNANEMFYGMNGDGIVRNTITSGTDSPSVVAAIGAVNDIHGYGSNLIAATNAGGIYYSSNGGASWAVSNVNSGAYWSVFAQSATNMFAGAGTAGNIYRSTNGGSSWTLVAAQANHGITSVETLFVASNGTVYAGGTNGSNAILASSSNNGTTWTNLFTGTGESGVWVVKVLNGKLYWGTNSALYVSSNADGSASTSYCSAGCANTATLPSNTVQDITLGEKTLYVATAGGIGVNPGANLSIWQNYTTTQLGSSFLNVQGVSFNNGRLYFATLAGVSNPVRSTDSRGNGLAFPASSIPKLPVGNTGSFLATKVSVYNTPDCSGEGTSYFYPEGVSGSGAVTPNSTSTALKVGAGSNNVYFIND